MGMVGFAQEYGWVGIGMLDFDEGGPRTRGAGRALSRYVRGGGDDAEVGCISCRWSVQRGVVPDRCEEFGKERW